MRVTLAQAELDFVSECSYYALGIGFLALAKAKYHLKGYTPKPLEAADIDACIDYDVQVANHWLKLLADYGVSVEGKDILELGPGSDLGTGVYLQSKGIGSYTAFDRHPNARLTSPRFYQRMKARGYPAPKVNLYVSQSFDLTELLPQSMDIIVSNAAFEHFDDVGATIRGIERVLRPGGILCAVVDLQTHSRWIRERDPNNIYRYPEWLYRAFHFPGQPNRVRTADYLRHLRDGWKAVEIIPENTFAGWGRVHRKFRQCDDLGVLSFAVCARKM